MRTSLHKLHVDIKDMSTSFGYVNERLLRQEIQRSFGREFTKEVTITSLQALAQLISKGKAVKIGKNPVDIVSAAKKLAAKLDNDEVGWKLLIDFFDTATGCKSTDLEPCHSVQNSDEQFKIFKEILMKEQLDANLPRQQAILSAVQATVRRFKTKLHQVPRTTAVTSLLQRLQLLCNLLAIHYAQDRIESLISCAGPGLMLAFYTTGEIGLSSAAPKSLAQFLPPNTCQMDVQGSISVVGEHAMIMVGEIKSSMSGKKHAKTQIKVRANLVKWAVKALFEDVVAVAVQGHLFVSKDMLRNHDDDEAVTAPNMHQDISIFMHYL
jgi:hypothetical protein